MNIDPKKSGLKEDNVGATAAEKGLIHQRLEPALDFDSDLGMAVGDYRNLGRDVVEFLFA